MDLERSTGSEMRIQPGWLTSWQNAHTFTARRNLQSPIHLLAFCEMGENCGAQDKTGVYEIVVQKFYPLNHYANLLENIKIKINYKTVESSVTQSNTVNILRNHC